MSSMENMYIDAKDINFRLIYDPRLVLTVAPEFRSIYSDILLTTNTVWTNMNIAEHEVFPFVVLNIIIHTILVTVSINSLLFLAGLVLAMTPVLP